MQKMQEYCSTNNAKEPYFFENDHNWFVSLDALHYVEEKLSETSCNNKDNVKAKAQIESLFDMEKLKINFAMGEIAKEVYREKLTDVIRKFFSKHGFPVLDQTDAGTLFYKFINEYYSEKGGIK